MGTLLQPNSLNNHTELSAEETMALASSLKDYHANSLWRLMLRRVFRQRSAIIGMVILGFLVLTALLAPVITSYDPE